MKSAFHEDSLQMIDFKMKCLEITTYAKIPVKFLRITSFQIGKKLQKLFCNKLTSCNLKIVFTSPVRVKSFFTFKDKLPKTSFSRLVYKYKCAGCIMVMPNTILNSEFVNNRRFSLE